MKTLVSSLRAGDVFRTEDRRIAHVAETFDGFLRALVWKDDEQGNRVQRAELFLGHELVEVGGPERRQAPRKVKRLPHDGGLQEHNVVVAYPRGGRRLA